MLPIVLVIGAFLLIVLAYGLTGPKEHFLKHWVPAFITGLFLTGLVPFASNVYWKRQQDVERCVQDREKRYELLGSVARTYTHLFKIHTRLADSSKEQLQEEQALRKLGRQKKAVKDVMQIHLARLAALAAERSDLKKERSRLEGQIGADSALISRIYTRDIILRYQELAVSYDIRTSGASPVVPTPDDPTVKGAAKLVESMAQEARDHECK